MADQMRDEQPGVRDLARQGDLAAYFGQARDAERRRLRIDAYELLFMVVFGQLTRGVEARRGHRDCMASVSSLRADCLDRFHNDMDAVLDDLFRSARMAIHNLEGWVSRRLVAVTVDAHRRRRGERGALQRPRIPKWLARELDNDKRLLELATEMLEWVGVEASAGIHDWPIEVWAAQRIATGDGEATDRAVARDVATVIAAMRKRPKWYADFVERPMGHKRAPVVRARRDGSEPTRDPARMTLDAHAEADDARLAELAALAVTAIVARVEQGENIGSVAVDVMVATFGAGTGSESLDREPGQSSFDDERVIARLADPATIDRIIAVVQDLLGT